MEDQGDYRGSWAFYERGNSLVRAKSRYRPEVIEDRHPPPDRDLQRGILRSPALVLAPRLMIRSSLSACRVRARR